MDVFLEAVTTPAPCGSWRSPLAAAQVAGQSLRLGSAALGADGTVYFVEGRPSEGGRCVLVARRPDGRIADLTPAPFSVRSRVHEYGGRAHVAHGTELYFVNSADQRIYHIRPGLQPQPLTIEATPDSSWRFAELVVDATRRRLIAVGEQHTPGGQPSNAIVSVDLNDGRITVLAGNHDFYAAPCLSVDGSRLAWLSWDHPHLPWDAAALWTGTFDTDGELRDIRHVAGNQRASVFQPGWHPDGTLYFMFEPDGFWNLHRLRADHVEAVSPGLIQGEFGMPLWELGVCVWGFSGPDQIVSAYAQQGRWRLAQIDLRDGRMSPLPAQPFATIGQVVTAPGRALVVEGSSGRGTTLMSLDLNSGQTEVLRQAAPGVLDPAYVSQPQAITFPTTEGDTAHAFYYPPCNPDFTPTAGERPPLLVMAHGGPTGAASLSLSLTVQFWTTRGFGVLDVNYRGSTGYGRAYRDRLRGQWGVFDVDDCVCAARALVDRDLVDGRRLAIRGSSAGGFTTLAALTFRDTFSAGASYYGVSDLAALMTDTHKFEARYGDGLVGPYPAAANLYAARSPIKFPERLRCPVIFFQGLQDKVVPPAQAELMVQALQARGVVVEYHAFAGEQHGFRRADTIERALQAELAFYLRVFGLGSSNPSRVVT